MLPIKCGHKARDATITRPLNYQNNFVNPLNTHADDKETGQAPNVLSISEHDELLMLRDAIQASNNVVLLTDPTLLDNPIIYVNNGFERLTGYSRQEVLGKNCRFLQGEDHKQEAVEQLRAAIRKGEGTQVELRNYRKDGTLFWNELHITPIFRNGKITNFLGVQNDITERKKAEAGEIRFRRAVESTSDVIILTGASLSAPGPRIEYVNDAFTRMTGYKPEEVIGRTPRMFQGPQTDLTVLKRMRRRLEAGKSFEGEVINYRKDGSAFVLAWTVSAIRDAQGKVTNWISTQQDVTERRRLERETLNISAREQRRIAGDLHDTLQQQLIAGAMHARSLAKKLGAKSKEEAATAHELYEMMQASVTTLRSVIRGVAPVQSDGHGLMVALENLCERTRELFGTVCSLTYEEPVVVNDLELAQQLYYIAQEAATNAAKHAGVSAVSIALARTNGHVALTVQDNGQGFDPERVAREPGMGLRLMAYRARLVGADFEVGSAPGEGTTVTCVFAPH